MFRVLPTIILVFFTVLFLSTFLSRIGVPSPFGGVVVYSDSMEPTMRRWDLALFLRAEPSRGDVIVYSLTPSFYIAHRYVGDYAHMDGYIITKGDANHVLDPFPVHRSMVKGVVSLVIWREIWIPLLAYAIIAALIEASRVKIVGLSSLIAYTTIIFFVLAVYGFTRPIPEATGLELPVLYLSRAELSPENCTLVISYVGTLQISNVELYVDGTRIPASFNATHITAEIPRDLASGIGKRGWANIHVIASLNNVGRLVGNYTVRIYPRPLHVGAANGSLLIRNSNGFPVKVDITFKYAYNTGDFWRQCSMQVIVDGGEMVLVDPPEGSRYAYAEVRYVLAGGERWIQVPVRY